MDDRYVALALAVALTAAVVRDLLQLARRRWPVWPAPPVPPCAEADRIRALVHAASLSGAQVARHSHDPVAALAHAVEARATLRALRELVPDADAIAAASGVDPDSLGRSLEAQEASVRAYAERRFVPVEADPDASGEEDDLPPLPLVDPTWWRDEE